MSGIFPSITPLISALPFQKNNYDFISVIDIGSTSVIFKVQSFNYRSTYFAAKVAPKSNGYILHDLNTLKSLIHSFIISVYDFFEDENNYYLILEFCQNGTLTSLIKSGQIITKDEMIFYMRKLSNAIYFCHSRGIAHRDIKPSNILLDSYGRPKLTGFEISEMLYAKNILNNDENDTDGYYAARKKGNVILIKKFFGSAPYLAPEIILQNPYDPFASDVWALGITFYEIATGNLPWNPESGQMMNDAICQASILFPNTVPSSIQKLIIAMTQVDPKKRPSMRAINECSLFKSEVPISLKLFTSKSACFDIPNDNNNNNNSNNSNNNSNNNNNNNNTDNTDLQSVHSQNSLDKKLRKNSNCVTFSNYQSFVNNKSCSQQISSKSLVFKPLNANSSNLPRKRNSARSSSNTVLKVYSGPLRPSASKAPFIPNE